jgi:RHS repeat-associated protein
VGGVYTQFVYNPDGTNLAVYSGGLTKGTISLPGGSTAVYNATGLNYIRHKDWLGSSRLATTWNHTVYSKEAYAPFGETYNEAGTPDRSFTGQDQDIVTGNYSNGNGVFDFLFRKYDPSAGRWLSPDPLGWGAVNPADPQSLNRYAYVENQPLNATDPNGLILCSVSSDGSDPFDSGTDSCPQGAYEAMLNQDVVVTDGCTAKNSDSTDCAELQVYSSSLRWTYTAPDPAQLMAKGVYNTGATNPCVYGAFLAGSGSLAFAGVAAGGGYAGAESAEVIASSYKIPAVIWAHLGLGAAAAYFHKQLAAAENSVCGQ